MQRRLLILALFLTSAIVLVATVVPGPAAAATIAQKKAQAAHIAAQVTALNTKMEFAVEAYDAATQKLDTVQSQIKTNQHELIVARYNLLVARQLLTQRVVSMYKQDKTDVLDVLLSTKSFNDLVTEVDAMRQVGQSDSTAVSTISALKKLIAQRRAALLAEGKQVQALVTQRAATKQQVLSDLQERQTKLEGVKQQITNMQAAAARAAKLAAARAAARAAAAARRAPSRSSPAAEAAAAGRHHLDGRRPRLDRVDRAAIPGRALRVGRRQPVGLRLLRPTHVLLRAARHLAAPQRGHAVRRLHARRARLRAARRPRLLRLLGRRHPPRRHLRRRRLHDRRALHRRRRALRLGLQRRLLRVRSALRAGAAWVTRARKRSPAR